MQRSLALALSVGLLVGLGVTGSTLPDAGAAAATARTGPRGDAVIRQDGTVATPASLATDSAPAEDLTVTTVDLEVAASATAAAPHPDGRAPEESGVTSATEPLVADELQAGRVVTDVLETDGFQTLGVTWPQDADAAALDLQVRTRDLDGQWSAWQPLDLADSGPDAGSPDAQRATRAGTDPLWVGEAEAVQLSVAAEQPPPADLSLSLVDVPVDSAEVAARTLTAGRADVIQSGLLSTVSDAPQVITREQWGARPQVCEPDVATNLVGAVLHHTAGSNDYTTVAQAMQQIRGDQAYHIDGRGWCDLGYNFVVDKWGNIYEGRDDSLTEAVIGVHAGGFNTGTLGVSMLGTYDAAPPLAQQQAVAQIVGWRLGYYGVNPESTMTYFTYGGENSKIPANTSITLPRVFGHRDVAYTACPGNGGYASLPGVRAAAAALSYGERFEQAKAVVHKMYADLLARDVDAGGLATWSAVLAGGSGLPALVGSLTDSREYVRLRITQAYTEALGREPEPAGMEHWYQRIRSGSASVDDVKRRFYDSDEFAMNAGDQPGDYVDLLYRTMFERPASEPEREYWAAKIDEIGRSAVVDAIWFSYEAARYRAGGYYRTFLDREADAAGQEGWAKVLLGSGEGAVRRGIAGSEEYRLLAIQQYS